MMAPKQDVQSKKCNGIINGNQFSLIFINGARTWRAIILLHLLKVDGSNFYGLKVSKQYIHLDFTLSYLIIFQNCNKLFRVLGCSLWNYQNCQTVHQRSPNFRNAVYKSKCSFEYPRSFGWSVREYSELPLKSVLDGLVWKANT